MQLHCTTVGTHGIRVALWGVSWIMRWPYGGRGPGHHVGDQEKIIKSPVQDPRPSQPCLRSTDYSLQTWGTIQTCLKRFWGTTTH
jgi:hypothetical protein